MPLYLVPSGSDTTLYRYDEGTTFVLLTTPGSSTTQYALASSPEDPSTVFIALSSAASGGGGSTQLYTSHDAGMTWGPFEAPAIFLERAGDLQLCATSSSTIYCWNGSNLSSAGGIYKSIDAGATWLQIVSLPDSFLGGWMAVGANYVFYAQQDAPYPVAANQRWGQISIWRAGVDGSGLAQIAEIPIGPNFKGGGTAYPPGTLLLRALDDDSVLVCARYGTTTLGVNIVEEGPTEAGDLMVAIGEAVLTPEDDCTFAFRVHFDSTFYSDDADVSRSSYNLGFQYEYESAVGPFWSEMQTFFGNPAPETGWDWWAKEINIADPPTDPPTDPPPPCTPRAVRFSIVRNTPSALGHEFEMQHFRVDEAFDAGLLLRVASDGTVTDVRPPGMRRPWDVLPLSATSWVLAGALSRDPSVPQPVTVMRTDDAGSTWSTTATIPVDEGFNFEAGSSPPHADNSTLLNVRVPGSVTRLAMMGSAGGPVPRVQQSIWISDDGAASWTRLLNTADVPPALQHPGFVLAAGPFYPDTGYTAISSRLATIVG